MKGSYPKVDLQVVELSRSREENSPLWLGEMQQAVAQIKANRERHQLVALVGDIVWTYYAHLDGGELGDVPLLLCGVKRFSVSYETLTNLKEFTVDSLQLTREKMKRYSKSELICEPLGDYIEKCVDMICQQLPQTERIAFISSTTFYGVYSRVVGEMKLKRAFPLIEVEYLDGREMNTAQLEKHLHALPANSVLLVSSWYTPAGEPNITPDFWKAFPFPLYTLSNNSWSAEAAVGGFYVNRGMLASVSASVLHRIMENEGVEEELMSALAHWTVNWEMVEKMGLEQRFFRPERTIYYNLPDSWLLRHKQGVVFTLIMFLLFLLFLIYRNLVRKQHNVVLTRANRSLEDINEKLIQMNRLRGNFLNNLSHQVKTPLNGLQGFASLLADEELESEERTMFARMVQENSMRLARLFDEVMELSNIEAGCISFENCQISATSLLHMVAQGRGELAFPIEMEAPQEDFYFTGDEARILQILEELVDNALKHSSCQKCVSVGLSQSDSAVTLYVKDKGKGIAPENYALIFERFFKVSDDELGSGLGLAMAKLLTERMGGRIWVESVLGEGSTFYVALPRI